MPPLPYDVGTWFCLPLVGGGYGVGVVARKRRGGRVLFGYFFGPRRSEVPTLNEVTELTPESAVFVCRFGDLGLLDGQWQLIGTDSAFDPAKFSLPAFGLTDGFGRSFLVTYSEKDPSLATSRERSSTEVVAGCPPDGLFGSGAVEIELSRRLAGANDPS